MDYKKVLIADNHPVAREGLARAIRFAVPGANVIEAGTIEEAEAFARKSGRLLLVVLDPAFPDARGLSVFLRLQYILPRTPLVLILGREDPALTGSARGMGAAGVLLKSAPVDHIASSLVAITKGQSVFPPNTVATSIASLRDRLARLSDAQRRVLFALANGRANKRIAYDLAISEATVKAHLTAIFRQLGVTNRMEAMLALHPLLGETAPC